MSSNYLTLTMYVERKPHDPEWALALVRRLWEHGLELGATMTMPAWHTRARTVSDDPARERIERTYRAASLGEWDAVRAYRHEAIEGFISSANGSINLWDRGVDMLLKLDTELTELESWTHDAALAELTLGKIELRVNRIYQRDDQDMPPHADIPESGFLVAPLRQAFLAFVHWSRLLCVEIQPIYAYGYNTDYRDEQAFFDSADRTFIAGLMAAHLPRLSEWLYDVRVEYVAPALASSRLAQQWLTMADRWVSHLSNGGLFAMKARDSHEAELMRQHERRVRAFDTPGVSHLFATAHADEIRFHYERALAIAQANGLAGHAQSLEDALRALAEHVRQARQAPPES